MASRVPHLGRGQHPPRPTEHVSPAQSDERPRPRKGRAAPVSGNIVFDTLKNRVSGLGAYLIESTSVAGYSLVLGARALRWLASPKPGSLPAPASVAGRGGPRTGEACRTPRHPVEVARTHSGEARHLQTRGRGDPKRLPVLVSVAA